MHKTLLTLALASLTSTAFAADTDGDEVEDSADNCVGVANNDQLDSNSDGYGDACVHPSAVLGSPVSLASGVRVFAAASVGNHAVLGTGSTVAARAFIASGLSSAEGVTVGVNTVLSRGASLAADVTLGDEATLGRSAHVGPGTVAGDFFTLGYAASIGEDGLLGDNIILGNLVSIGDRADLQGDIVIARSTQLGDDVVIGNGTIIGPDGDLQDGVEVASSARLRKNVTVQDGASIGAGARIGRDVTVRRNASIGANAVIRAGADIGENTTVSAGAYVERNEVIPSIGGILLVNGARRFSDGTVADRCESYRNAPQFNGTDAVSGVYTVNAGGAEYPVYCDMVTDGGGWTMCFSETGVGVVNLRTDEFTGTFGTDGYRARCRDISFSEVLFTAHASDEHAWFSRDTPGDLTASNSGFGGSDANSGSAASSGEFTAHGVASASGYSGKYQLLICDTGAGQARLWMEVGFMVSGFLNGGYKNCGSWTGDTTSPYYRINGDYRDGNYQGQSFNQNGHQNLPDELLSVGIR